MKSCGHQMRNEDVDTSETRAGQSRAQNSLGHGLLNRQLERRVPDVQIHGRRIHALVAADDAADTALLVKRLREKGAQLPLEKAARVRLIESVIRAKPEKVIYQLANPSWQIRGSNPLFFSCGRYVVGSPTGAIRILCRRYSSNSPGPRVLGCMGRSKPGRPGLPKGDVVNLPDVVHGRGLCSPVRTTLWTPTLASETRRIKLGHGIDPGVAYGPVLHEGVRARTRSHVEDAVRRGGTLVVGGSVPRGSAYEHGFFFEPTLIDDAADDALVMTQEGYRADRVAAACPQ